MAGTGNTQIIGGKSYVLYSPEWYAARNGQIVSDAQTAGTAAGAAEGAAARSSYATRYPEWQLPNPPTAGGVTPGTTHTASSPSLEGLNAAASTPFSQASANASGDHTRVMDALMGMAAPTSGAPAGAAPSALPPEVTYAGPTEDQETASRDAIFARTKDNAANTASASLTGLQDALTSRGMTGGGYEAGQIGQTLAREANTIGEGDRQQATSELSRAADVADKKVSTAVEQRGQDLAAANSQRQFAMEQAQLAQQQRQTSLAALEAALSATKGSY